MVKKSSRRVVLETLEQILDLQLESIRELLKKEEDTGGVGRLRKRKRKSLVDLSVEILTEERRPIHVDELVELLNERFGRLTDRDSLSSALAKKAQRGILVRRVAPAKFIAIESE